MYTQKIEKIFLGFVVSLILPTVAFLVIPKFKTKNWYENFTKKKKELKANIRSIIS